MSQQTIQRPLRRTALALGPFRQDVTNLPLSDACRTGLSEAHLVSTAPLNRLLLGAPHALARRRIVAVDGPPGAGKSTALEVLAAAAPVPMHIVCLRPRTTGRAVMLELYGAVTGRPHPGGTQRDIETDLKVELAAKPRIIAVDEAQNVGLQGLQSIRFLHDLHTGRWGLVLAGKGILAKLAKEEMLANRVGLRVEFHALNNSTRTATLTQLHPVLAAAPPGLLDTIDALVCRGQLRRWVVFLEWVLDLGPGEPLTRDLARAAADLMTGEDVLAS